MALATREAILSAKDWETKDVEIPKWGTVRIRNLTVAERLDFAKEFGAELTGEDSCKLLCKVVVASVIDEEGNQVFKWEDVEKLLTKNWANIEKLADAVFKFNGLAREVIDEAEKNLKTTESVYSPSASVSHWASSTQTA